MAFIRVNQGAAEFTVKKSRFIVEVRHIAARSDVKREIDCLRERYVGATHVCSAFIADDKGDDFGYDDDGEPSGTAGKPIYSALAASGARHCLVAVVRYFGGIKLGAGGLTRTYRQVTAQAIEQLGVTKVAAYNKYRVECDAENYKKITAAVKNSLCKIEQIVYNDNVSFALLCPSDADVCNKISQLGITPQFEEQRYIAENSNLEA